MRTIARILHKLPPSARPRVLGYVAERVRERSEMNGEPTAGSVSGQTRALDYAASGLLR